MHPITRTHTCLPITDKLFKANTESFKSNQRKKDTLSQKHSKTDNWLNRNDGCKNMMLITKLEFHNQKKGNLKTKMSLKIHFKKSDMPLKISLNGVL